MDWLQFVSSVISSLAWPSAVVFLGLVFREQVRALLSKMKTLKAPGGIEADFTERLNEVVEEVKAVPEPANPPAQGAVQLPYKEEHVDDDAQQVYGPVRTSALILDAWRSIENVIYDLSESYQKERPKSGTWLSIINRMNALELVPRPLLKVILNLSALRNKVAHSRFEPDDSAARSYLETSQKVVTSLESIREQIGMLPNQDND